jgi:hypothetical protein
VATAADGKTGAGWSGGVEEGRGRGNIGGDSKPRRHQRCHAARGSRRSQPAAAAMELSGWLLGPL